jgi:hypothetical protein
MVYRERSAESQVAMRLSESDLPGHYPGRFVKKNTEWLEFLLAETYIYGVGRRFCAGSCGYPHIGTPACVRGYLLLFSHPLGPPITNRQR